MSCDLTIVTGPLDLWWAPKGEAFPDIGVAPTGNWTQIGGSAGATRRITEDGIHILSDLTTNSVMSDGDSLPQCELPTEQNLRVTAELFDTSSAALRAALNFNAVVNDAGPPDVNRLSLNIGVSMVVVAILLRGVGKSPDFLTGDLQFEFPNAVSIGAFDLAYTKGTPAAAALEFKALAGANQIVYQNA